MKIRNIFLLFFIVTIILIQAADNKGKGPMRRPHSQGRRTDLLERYALFGKGKHLYTPRSVQDMINSGDIQMIEEDNTLDLSRQGLTSLEGINEYPGIENVVTLNLSGNHIHHIEPQYFANMPALNMLDLSFNRITTIPANIFSLARSLDSANLESNRISAIETDALLDSSLTELNLGNNELRTFDPFIVENQRELELLDLSNNKLPETEVYRLRNALDGEISELYY